MAATGTCTQVYNTDGNLATTIRSVTTASNSQPFSMKASIYSSYGVFGTFGAAGAAQWQGSNDGGTTWENIGLSFTAGQGGTLTPGQVFYSKYQLVITGGDGTTSINADVVATIPR